mgnify:CR=1 FL=1
MRGRLRGIWTAACAIVLAPGVIVIRLAIHWPFTRTRVARSLEHATKSRIQFGRFRKTYFPHPGAVAEDDFRLRISGVATGSLLAVPAYSTITPGGWYRLQTTFLVPAGDSVVTVAFQRAGNNGVNLEL